ncbi:hypothetical protein EW145_g5245 [Phellinidium pouzarii]|uniref:C2H2-type domain-containing protein n=1 Tax=Phellinidium pouzarii TaxID=167371 RepID=A0A4S4L5H2_9AGAM|nr:hypothetical protein EW145_g5245 [Phellinidium pouzarii]
MPAMPRARPFVCAQCGMSFTRPSDLARHSHTHNPNAPRFHCTFPGCSHSTLQKSNLETHYSAVHLKEKPHKCILCRMSYGDDAALIRHEKKKHNYYRRADKPYARPSGSLSRPRRKQRVFIDLTTESTESTGTASHTPSLSSSNSSTSSPPVASFPSTPATTSTSLMPSPAPSCIPELGFNGFLLNNSASTMSSLAPSGVDFDFNTYFPSSVMGQFAYGQVLGSMATSSAPSVVPQSNCNGFIQNSAVDMFSYEQAPAIVFHAPDFIPEREKMSSSLPSLASTVPESDFSTLLFQKSMVDQSAYQQVSESTASSSGVPELDSSTFLLQNSAVDPSSYEQKNINSNHTNNLYAPLECSSWDSVFPTYPDFHALTVDGLMLGALDQSSLSAEQTEWFWNFVTPNNDQCDTQATVPSLSSSL